MKQVKTALVAAAMLALIPAAHADVFDPLHGSCTGCTSNGTNLSMNGTGTFGWLSSPPGLTGTLFIDFLIPNDVNLATFTMPGVTGFATGTPALFSPTAWTVGDLTNYLGAPFAGAQPPNPLSSFLTATNTVDGAATGYFDFILGGIPVNTGLLGPGNTPNDLFTLASLLPLGSIITAFMVTCLEACLVTTTAQSESLLVNQVPLPGAVWLFGTGLVGLIALGRKKKTYA
jgi:hypothetical protein